MVVGNEVGDEGTPHLQGFVVFQKRTQFSTVKNRLPKAHIEVMHVQSCPAKAIAYCKKDGDFLEFGDPTLYDQWGPSAFGKKGGQAASAMFAEVIKLAKQGNFTEIEEKFPSIYISHYNTIKRIAMDNPRKYDPIPTLNNEWIYGSTGLGKSSIARLENPGAYIHLKNKWWLGYQGEDCVIFDDIGRSEAKWIGDKLKNWADHYPFPVETKGDGMMVRPKRLIVTSNYSIRDLFGEDNDMCEALERRFKQRHIINPFPHLMEYRPAAAAPPPPPAQSVEQNYDEITISSD